MVPPVDSKTESTYINSQPAFHFNSTHHPADVGILAMEIYFPKTYVSQMELEKYDEAGTGKYTIGLGQTKMAFCGDNEDIHSFCLTAVKSLMEKYNISYSSIGRLEVGTETIIDKSKSVKSVLMQLFAESGNTDIEGIDTTNACYGGTNALFNTISWIESSYWDGRYGLVVAGDIAVYGTKAARPTGGAGVVVMLVGPNAPIVMERGIRASHMEHAYDFYKPDLTSEYPTVDGKLSNSCYLKAVDQCYMRYSKKFEARNASKFDLNKADYFIFHTPYVKLVQKSVARLQYLDFLQNPDREEYKDQNVQQFRHINPEETYANADLEKIFRKISEPMYEKKVVPSTYLATNIGNTYCGSTYCSLLSLLSNVSDQDLIGKRVVAFSYGSGLASSMFSFIIKRSVKDICSKANVIERLNQRIEISPEKYVEVMKLREQAHNKKSFAPVYTTEYIEKGSFYLTQIDELFRRSYAIRD